MDRIEELLCGFDQQTDESKKVLQSMLATISEGKVPDQDNVTRMSQSISELQRRYDEIYAFALSETMDDGMPQKGEPVSLLIEAVNNSRLSQYKKKIDEVERVFKQFIKVRSLVESFTAALRPYQEQAGEMLNQLASTPKTDMSDIEEGSAAPKLFMEALACDDLDSDDGVELMENISSYFPPRVFLGLSRHKYFISEDESDISDGRNNAITERSETTADKENETIVTEDNIGKNDKTLETVSLEVDSASEEQNDNNTRLEHSQTSGLVSAESLEDESLPVIETSDESPFVKKVKEKKSLLLEKGEIGLLSIDVSNNENKAVTSKTFLNDMRKGREGIKKSILSDIYWRDFVTKQRLLVRGIPSSYANESLNELFKNGYLRQCNLSADKTIYYVTERLKKAFTNKKAAEYIGVRKKGLDEWKELSQDKEPTAMACMFSYDLMCCKLMDKLGINENQTVAESGKMFSEAFCAILHNKTNDTEKYIALGAFLTDTNDCNDFFEVVKTFLENITPKGIIVGGADKEKAHALADVLIDTFESLSSIHDIEIYSFIENEYYSFWELGDKERPDDSIAEQTSEKADELSLQDDISKPEAVDDSGEEVIDPNLEETGQDDTIPMTASEGKPSEGTNKAQLSSDNEANHYRKKISDIIIDGDIPSALTMARALSKYSSQDEENYCFLAYACDDPALEKTYNCSDLQSVFSYDYGLNEAYDCLAVSAFLRMFFSSAAANEPYNVMSIVKGLSGNIVLENNTELKNLLFGFVKSFGKINKGFDPEMLTILLAGDSTYNMRNEIRTEVCEFLNMKPETSSKPNARITRTTELLFGHGSSFRSVLDYVAEERKDKIDEIKAILTPYLYEDAIINGICSVDQIDLGKIKAYVNDVWYSTRNLSTRNSRNDNFKDPAFSITVRKALDTIRLGLSWATLCSDQRNGKISNDDISFLQAKREELTASLLEVKKGLNNQKHEEPTTNAAFHVLGNTLTELYHLITGTQDTAYRRYYYNSFLRDNCIEMDENFIPYLEEDFSEIAPMNICKRIVEHAEAKLPEWEEVVKQIFEDPEKGCDFGHARLIQAYMRHYFKDYEWPRQYDFDLSIRAVSARLEEEEITFQAQLDLAESYGWIQEAGMIERIIADMEQRRNHYVETENYGFWFRTAGAYIKSIQREAAKRKPEFEEELKRLRIEKGDMPILDEVERLISEQMYTVVQDYLDQVKKSNRTTPPKSVYLSNDDSYLMQFIKNYDNIYRWANEATNANIVDVYKRKHLPPSVAKTGEELMESWPRSEGTAQMMERRLNLFLRNMSLPVKKVQRITGSQTYYMAEFDQPDQSVDYPHPIGAFGSEMLKNGLRINLVFGKRSDTTFNTELQRLMTSTVVEPTIILLDSPISLVDRRRLAQTIKTQNGNLTPFLYIDRVLLFEVAKHTLLERWNVLLQCSLPFVYYNPYTENHTVDICPEMFIGRRNELRSIISETGANIVYGGRQLGKTALLKRAKKLQDNRNNGDWAFYVDIKDKSVEGTAQLIYETLITEGFLLAPENGTAIRWDDLTWLIIQRMRDKKNPVRQMLLMLDEADRFLLDCGKDDCHFAPISCLKRIQSSVDHFKFVFAGLHNVLRLNQRLQEDDSPLPQLGSITMKPLPFEEGRELVELPLSYLGFKLKDKDPQLIAHILSSTNYFPGLIQCYCSNLVRSLCQNNTVDVNQKPPYYLEKAQILTLLKDPDFQENIRQKYLITLGVDSKERGYYYTIAYALAHCYYDRPSDNQFGYTAQDIKNICRDFDIYSISSLTMRQLESLLDELVELNVLRRKNNSKGYTYCFNRTSFRHMLGNEEDVDTHLLEIMEKEAI